MCFVKLFAVAEVENGVEMVRGPKVCSQTYCRSPELQSCASGILKKKVEVDGGG